MKKKLAGQLVRLFGLLLIVSLRAAAQVPPLPIAPASAAWVPKSIAYVKASNTTHDYQFGYSVAISGDGKTLAVGSVNESSSSKGISGNQKDRAAVDAGAAYVYVLRNGAWTQQAYVKAS